MLSNGISASSGLQPSQDSNHPLGFAESCCVYEDHVLLFGHWVKEVGAHGAQLRIIRGNFNKAELFSIAYLSCRHRDLKYGAKSWAIRSTVFLSNVFTVGLSGVFSEYTSNVTCPQADEIASAG